MPTVSLSSVLSATTILDNSGNILSNGRITSYLSGSTTLSPTYANNTGTILNTNPIIVPTTGRVALIYLDIDLSYKFIVSDTSGNTLAIYDNINSILTSNNPFLTPGMIMIWSGIITAIPQGWALCDGQGGRPDLRDKFVVGSGNIYNQGDTGGSPNSIVVAHTHNATVVDPGHFHTTRANSGGDRGAFAGGVAGAAANIRSSTNPTNVTVNINTTGQSGVNANLPPYYALAYIIKS